MIRPNTSRRARRAPASSGSGVSLHRDAATHPKLASMCRPAHQTSRSPLIRHALLLALLVAVLGAGPMVAALPSTCPPGTSLVGKACTLCAGNTTSPGGPTSVAVCKACPLGQVANANKTACGEDCHM